MVTLSRSCPALLIAMVMTLLAGCAKQTPPQLEARYTAARNIQDTDDRDRAMEDVALDAVRAGQGRLAMDATRAITENARRDHVARDCAEILDKQGDRATAQEFVQMISDTDMRDRMNRKFANEPPKTPSSTK